MCDCKDEGDELSKIGLTLYELYVSQRVIFKGIYGIFRNGTFTLVSLYSPQSQRIVTLLMLYLFN